MTVSQFNIGENVVAQIPKSLRRKLKYSSVPGHATGVVRGYRKQYITYINNYGKKPGVYYDHSKVIVSFSDKQRVVVDSIYLANAAHKQTDNVRKMKLESDDRAESLEYIEKLPPHKYAEGDLVRYARPDIPHYQEDEELGPGVDNADFIVVLVLFSDTDTQGHVNCEYCVSDSFYGQSYIVPEQTLSLRSRGNIWKYHNGRCPSFNNIWEEAELYSLVGKSIIITKDNFSTEVPIEVAQTAIKDGKADYYRRGRIGDDSYVVLEEFDDRELGDRVRNAIMKRDGLTAPHSNKVE